MEEVDHLPKWDDMTPRERDALVAERVIGLTLRRPDPRSTMAAIAERAPGYWVEVERYSTEIAAAWEIMQTAKGWLFSRRKRFIDAMAGLVRERFCEPIAWPDVLLFLEPADICLAALMAIGVEP